MHSLAVETINPATLPAVPFTARSQLPNVAAIYFVMDANDTIHYIGRAKSLCFRWQAHHRLEVFSKMPDMRIAYLAVTDISLMPEIEKALIDHFSPPHNAHTGSYTPKAVRGSVHGTFSLRLSDEGREILADLSQYYGITQTAVLELAIREKAKREGVVLEQASALKRR